LNWVLLKNSFLVSSLATLLALGFGSIAALWMTGLAARRRNVGLALAIIALAFPPFLVTNCWLHYLGHTGVWRRWLPLNIISLGGTAWILALLLWPITLLAVTSAWRRLEPWHLESDMALTGWPLIRLLLFPLARTALTQAAVLTLVLALNNFAVPAILQVKVFPAEMWIRFNTTFDAAGALQLSLPLIVAPLLTLFWFAPYERPWPHLEAPVPPKLLRQQLGRGWFCASGAAGLLLFILSVGLPLFQIISVRRTWTELPGALAASQSATWNSFWFAALSASIVTVLGLIGAVRHVGCRPATRSEGRNPKPERRPRSETRIPNPTPMRSFAGFGIRISAFGFLSGFGSRVSDLISDWLLWLFFLTPGVLLGIALIQVFNRPWLAGFYHGAGIVILAFVIRYLALGCNTAHHGARGVDHDLVDVARLEGATRWQMLRHVLWPQLSPQIRAAWYIVFLLCLWDVESIILVVPPGGETLALRVFNLLHYGHNTQVNALCLTLLVLAVAPLFLWRASTFFQRALGP
jgi:iron(III) transport system permease protein